MEWLEAETELEALRARRNRGEDVLGALEAFAAKVREVVHQDGPGQVEDPRVTSAKVVLLRCLAAAGLPPAGTRLEPPIASIAAELETRVITAALEEQMEARLAACLEEAEAVRLRASELEREIETLETLNGTLRETVELMDVLAGTTNKRSRR